MRRNQPLDEPGKMVPGKGKSNKMLLSGKESGSRNRKNHGESSREEAVEQGRRPTTGSSRPW